MKLKNTPNAGKDKISNIKSISEKIQKSIKAIMGNDDIFLKLGEKIFMKTKEKIEKNDMKYISEGKEGVVYKIEIKLPNKEKKIFLATKRRFDNYLQEEIHMQKDFSEMAKKSATGVEVPETLGEIKTENGKYFLMEYINGKTLFNLKMEKIAETFYKKFKEKYHDFFKKIKGINKHIDQKDINKASYFDFENDTEARERMAKTINFLNENAEPMIQKYTGVKGIALLDKKNYDKVIEKIYYDKSLCSPIFTQKDGWTIQKTIKDFLFECHKAGLFHRDLGGNASNIMFVHKDNTTTPVIIDFGISKKHEGEAMKDEYEKGEGPYGDEYETYIPDTHICEIIKGLTYHPPIREPGELYY